MTTTDDRMADDIERFYSAVDELDAEQEPVVVRTSDYRYVSGTEAAAAARKVLRTAVRDAEDGDPLHGLTVSVRTDNGSLSSAVQIAVGPVRVDELQNDDAMVIAGHGRWSEQAHAIVDRVGDLVPDVFAWADGRHSHVTVHFDVGAGPKALHPAPSVRTEDERNAPPRPVPACPDCRRPRPTLDANTVCEHCGHVQPAPEPEPVPAPRRPELHVVTDDQVLVLEALDGRYGSTAEVVARLAVNAAIEDDTVADSAAVARKFRGVYAALGMPAPDL